MRRSPRRSRSWPHERARAVDRSTRMAAAMGASRQGPLPVGVSGFPSTPAPSAATKLFVALKGDNRDGHDFVRGALAAEAPRCVVVAANRCVELPSRCAAARRTRCACGIGALAAAARARTRREDHRRHRSVGKTTTKEMLRLALANDWRDPCLGRLLQQSLGRAAVAGALPGDAEYGVFEIGINHSGEIAPSGAARAPACGADHHRSRRRIWNFSAHCQASPTPSRKSFEGLEPGGAAVLNRDNSLCARLKRRADEAGVTRIVSFGEHANADARLIKCALHSGWRRHAVQGGYFGQPWIAISRRAGPPSRRECRGRAGGDRAGRTAMCLAAPRAGGIQPPQGTWRDASRSICLAESPRDR